MNTNAARLSRLCASPIFITTSCAYSPVLEHAFPPFFRPTDSSNGKKKKKKWLQTNSKRILVMFSLIDWNKLGWDVNFISREGEKEEKERKEQENFKGSKTQRGGKNGGGKATRILSGEKRERLEDFFAREARRPRAESRKAKLARMCRRFPRIFHGPSTAFWRSTQVSFANMSAKRSFEPMA